MDRLIDVAPFGSDPGNLRARIYVPNPVMPDPPLVVILHGCTQSAASYDNGAGWSQLADRYGFITLYPEQRRANNANLCFNWFEPGDIIRGSGEALSIRQIIEAAVLAHGIDRTRIWITGLSAGGAMTSVMLATYPEVFAGGAIIAGLPYGCASSVQEAFGAMRARGRSRPEALSALVRGASAHDGSWPTISVWHGSGDATVNPDNADAIVDQWLPLHGIAKADVTDDVVDGYPHRVWRNAAGAGVVETYSITGMGHGTPLDARGIDPFETAGPHMLDVGISSSGRIASFWGLVPSSTTPDTGRRHPTVRPRDRLHPRHVSEAVPERIVDNQHDFGIARIIHDALQAAGLKR